MSEQAANREEGYKPTPADEALYATLLTVQVVGAIQQAYADGKIADFATYNKLYELAGKADGQAHKLLNILEQQAKEAREEEARQLRIANGMEQ